MIKQTNFCDPWKSFVVLFFCVASGMAPAAPITVRAPVVKLKGMVIWAMAGSTKFQTLNVGESLTEGSTIQTKADGHVLFSPVPGVAVSEAENTSASLLRLAVTKDRGQVQKREALLRLITGMLSFSLEKRDMGTTNFAVETPSGRMDARGSVGTISVVPPCVKIASLSGKVAFSPKVGSVLHAAHVHDVTDRSAFISSNSSATVSDVPIIIPPGCFLAVCGKGDNVEIRLINTIERTWTNYSVDGRALGTRAATVGELESTRGFFETAFAHESLAVVHGLLSAESTSEVTWTLLAMNQSFAAVGLRPVDDPPVGSSARNTNFISRPSGFSDAPINPANTSGEIISPER